MPHVQHGIVIGVGDVSAVATGAIQLILAAGWLGPEASAVPGYSGLPMSCTQAGVPEPAEDVLGGHAPQRLAQGLVEPGLRPRPGPSKQLLDLREHLLDRGVVRTGR